MRQLAGSRRGALGFRAAVIAGLAFFGSPSLVAAEPSTACESTDGFGYRCTDSNAAEGGPTYSWIDVSESGQNTQLSTDGSFYPITLPFDFSFYGNLYSNVAVSSNGQIYFENLGETNVNTSIPSAQPADRPSTFIAAYWDDLDPGSGGGVFFEIQGTAPLQQLIVQWQDVPLNQEPNSEHSFQVVLFEGAGNILLQYLDPDPEAGSQATVGIQGTPTVGHEYGFNSAVLTPDLAVCYYPPGIASSTCLVPEPGRITLELASLATLGWLARVIRRTRRSPRHSTRRTGAS